jgi:hypothetical protein
MFLMDDVKQKQVPYQNLLGCRNPKLDAEIHKAQAGPASECSLPDSSRGQWASLPDGRRNRGAYDYAPLFFKGRFATLKACGKSPCAA